MKTKAHNTVDIISTKFNKISSFVYVAEVFLDTKAIEIGVNLGFNEDELNSLIKEINEKQPTSDYLKLIPKSNSKNEEGIKYYYKEVFNNQNPSRIKKIIDIFRNIFLKKSKKEIVGGGYLFKTKFTTVYGTLGAVVSIKNEKFAITSKHVLNNFQKEMYYSKTGNQRFEIGTVYKTDILKNVDIGLIKLTDKHIHLAEKVIKKIGKVKNERINPVLDLDVLKYGAKSNYTEGIITSVYSKRKGSFLNAQFIVEPKRNYNVFSYDGDSGSLVLSNENKPIGIVDERLDKKVFVLPMNLIDNKIINIKFN